MTAQRRDQPSQVSTEEVPRAPDEHVVTTDVIADAEPGISEPPATPAATPKGENDDQAPAPGEPKKQTTQSRRRRRNSEARINELTAKLSDAELRDAENVTRIAELSDQIETLRKATPKAPEPQLQDFASPREYAKAFTKWEADSATPTPKTPAKTTPPAKKTPAAPPPKTVPDEEIQSFHTRGKEKLGDEFMDALQEEGTAVNQLMGEFMLDSDVGPEIYVHLANNPDESRKIFDSSPLRATKALDRLAAKAAKGELDVGEGGELQPNNPPPKDTSGKSPAKATKAPQPPSDTKGGSAPIGVNPEAESMDDYAARRRKEEARRAGLPV